MERHPESSKTTLLLLLVAFLVPVALAAVVLKAKWYQEGATNHGQLLNNLSYQQLQQPNPVHQQWQIITFVPSQCAPSCQAHLQQLQQVHVALGRERPRVHPIAFSDAPLSAPDGVTVVVQPQLQPLLPELAVVIVDPLGQWVLHYQTDELSGLLKDLRKLLKLSRIG